MTFHHTERPWPVPMRIRICSSHEPCMNRFCISEVKTNGNTWCSPTLHVSTTYKIGRLLDELKENPRKRETVIVLTSDHGWNLGENPLVQGCHLRNTTRVPFMVVLPGVIKPELATISRYLMSTFTLVSVTLRASPNPIIWRDVPFCHF